MKKKKSKRLSVVLATYNEEHNLGPCLDSVKDIADEIVIVDGGSTDNTVPIAKKYRAKIMHTTNPSIFHINKQKGLEEAAGKWILQLDADERLTKKLRSEIKNIIKRSSAKSESRGYYIARKNYFCGKWMRYGGMYPDYVIRLFQNGNGRFPCKSVHEQIEIVGDVGYLHEPMIHNTYPTFADYMKKADTYTSLTAREMAETGMGNTVITLIRYTLVKPISVFLSLFIRHRGILDGWWGLVWCFMSGMHYPMAYIKFLGLLSRTQ